MGKEKSIGMRLLQTAPFRGNGSFIVMTCRYPLVGRCFYGIKFYLPGFGDMGILQISECFRGIRKGFMSDIDMGTLQKSECFRKARNKMRKALPTGYDNFEKIRKQDFYYVDKTMMIKEILDNDGEVNLFTRPCRFGKTPALQQITVQSFLAMPFFVPLHAFVLSVLGTFLRILQQTGLL